MEKELCILMLEDRLADVEMIEHELRKGGLHFVSRRAETEEDLRKDLIDFKPDVILSDYELPTFDGISALIISRAIFPDVPFIFVTGVMGEEMAINMLHRGATDFVLKDRLSRLVPAVQRALDEMEGQAKRREAEEALKESEAEMRNRAERLTHFLTVASHELRHPLTVIKGYTGILNEFEDGMTRDMIREIYADMDTAADRLTRLIQELMDLSVIEGEKFCVETQPVDPRRMCRDAIEEIRKRGHLNEVEVEIADGTGPLNVDPDTFLALLTILLDNACLYSEDSSRVDMEIKREDGEVTIAVKDRGPGISETGRENVFERFYQVDDALHHSKPGMGLGLYIARKIVTAHGGRISCEPRDGGGTVFRVTLMQ